MERLNKNKPLCYTLSIDHFTIISKIVKHLLQWKCPSLFNKPYSLKIECRVIIMAQHIYRSISIDPRFMWGEKVHKYFCVYLRGWSVSHWEKKQLPSTRGNKSLSMLWLFIPHYIDLWRQQNLKKVLNRNKFDYALEKTQLCF